MKTGSAAGSSHPLRTDALEKRPSGSIGVFEGPSGAAKDGYLLEIAPWASWPVPFLTG